MDKKITVIILIAIISIVILGANKPTAVSPQAKWEYKIVNLPTLAGIKSMEEAFEKAFGKSGALSFEGAKEMNNDIAKNMSLLGEQGWELVCFNEDTGFVFKRLK